MIRRFEYTDEKSNKFWEIECDGLSHTVRYGTIGSHGRTKTTEFDSGEAASNDAERLIGQKTERGYIEVSAQTAPADLVRTLLSGLCKTEQDRNILDRLCAAAIDFSDAAMIFKADDGYERECQYETGSEVPPNEDCPESFRQIATTVRTLCWSGGGAEIGFAISPDGSPVADGWLFEELSYHREEEYNRVTKAGRVNASFLAGQNGLFFDPTDKLSNGEPGLAFVSHEECRWVSVASTKDLDYGQILLRMLADAATATKHIPEIYF